MVEKEDDDDNDYVEEENMSSDFSRTVVRYYSTI